MNDQNWKDSIEFRWLQNLLEIFHRFQVTTAYTVKKKLRQAIQANPGVEQLEFSMNFKRKKSRFFIRI